MEEQETTEQFARRRMREKLIEELRTDCPFCSAMKFKAETIHRRTAEN